MANTLMPPAAIDWTLVLQSGLAGGAVIWAFYFALRHAGRAAR